MKLLVSLLFILVIILYFTYERKYDEKYKPTLERDGFIFLDSADSKHVLKHLPNGYQFMDYKYTIEGCTLSTFHRDVTSSQYIFKTEHPTYTFIKYEHEGPALSVCPGSHRTVPLLISQPITVNSKYVLFNCDVVHAGSLNLKKLPRKAIQYKIIHDNDLTRLKHLNGIHKVKKGDCTKNNHPVLDVMYRKLSILFSYIVNHQLTPYLQSRESNVICKLFGEERCFYNK
tara:strand:+ start:45 stop:731 length:687 start_codon:yes stop_codon:yes gene_type:complete